MKSEVFLMMAEASLESYGEPSLFSKWYAKIGSGSADLIEKRGTQAYCFETELDRVLVFRGTETNQLTDWRSDVNVNRMSLRDGGCVHEGFANALDHVWSPAEKWLKTAGNRKVWITGHSLGGALALLAAARVDGVEVNLCTYGQPRVGDQLFAMNAEKKLGSRYCRVVHHRDIVARVPLFTTGFRHFGREFYIENGKVEEVDFGIETMEDALRQVTGKGVVIPTTLGGVLEPILRVVESATHPENVGPAVELLRKIQAPFSWIGGASLNRFFENLVTKVKAHQDRPNGVIGPVDDHDLRHYIGAFRA